MVLSLIKRRCAIKAAFLVLQILFHLISVFLDVYFFVRPCTVYYTYPFMSTCFRREIHEIYNKEHQIKHHLLASLLFSSSLHFCVLLQWITRKKNKIKRFLYQKQFKNSHDLCCCSKGFLSMLYFHIFLYLWIYEWRK